MKNRNKRTYTACLAMVLCVAVCVTGCEHKSAQDSGKGIDPMDRIELGTENPNLIPDEQEYTEYVFSDKGMTDYMIVLPENYGENIALAVKELQDRFREATGGELSSVSETMLTDAGSGKYLFLGDTRFLLSDIDKTEDTLGCSGYAIQTVDDDVFIAGATETGTLNGVYEFLKRTFNYRFYAPEVWQINNYEDETVYLPILSVSVRLDVDMPSLRIESVENALTTRRRYRLYTMTELLMPVNGASYHVATAILPPEGERKWLESHPEWYATIGQECGKDQVIRDKYGDVAQLCYNAHGDAQSYELMLEEQFRVMISSIRAADADPKQLHYLWYTQMDNREWCGCDACKKDREMYGSPAGSYIKMANRLAKMLEEWIEEEGIGRRVNLVIYAYLITFAAPTYVDDDIMLADNIALYYAPIEATFVYDLEDDLNKYYYDNMVNWSKVMGDGGLLFWAYNAVYCNDYLVPYYGFDAYQPNIEILKRFNVKLLYSQNDFENLVVPDWGFLMNFLQAELMWDSSQDVERLIDDYFTVYFREAATPMRKYFTNYCNWYNYAAKKNDFTGAGTTAGKNTMNADFFPFAQLQSWLGCIDDAYKAVEKYRESDEDLYEKLRDRICLESITPRYLLLEIHKGSYDVQEYAGMETDWENDVARLGITSRGEGGQRWY